jgi:hypothetical protein
MFGSLIALQVGAVAVGALFLGFFSANELSIDSFEVTEEFKKIGYNSEKVKELFVDELVHLTGEAVLSKQIDLDDSNSMVDNVYQSFKVDGQTGGVAELMEQKPTIAEISAPKAETMVKTMPKIRLTALDLFVTEDVSIQDINENTAHIGIKGIEDYFGLTPVVNGISMLLGYGRTTVNADLSLQDEKKVKLKVRVELVESSNPNKVKFGATQKVEHFTVEGDMSEVVDIIKTAAFQTMAIMNPYITLIHTLRVEKKYGNNEYPGTKKAINEFIATVPLKQHYLAYALKARVLILQHESSNYSKQKSTEILLEAKANLQHSLRLNPDYLLALLNLGLINAWEGNHDEANRLFYTAVVLHPDYFPARITWSEFLEITGDFDGAIVQAEAALLLEPYSLKALNELAILYQKTDQLEEYESTLQKLNLLTPLTLKSVN